MTDTISRAAVESFRAAARVVVAHCTDGDVPRWKVMALMASALGAEIAEAPTGEDKAAALALVVDFMEAEADPDVRR